MKWLDAATDDTPRNAAEEALRGGDRRKDEFLATLAHELRNSLAPIRIQTHCRKAELAAADVSSGGRLAADGPIGGAGQFTVGRRRNEALASACGKAAGFVSSDHCLERCRKPLAVGCHPRLVNMLAMRLHHQQDALTC